MILSCFRLLSLFHLAGLAGFLPLRHTHTRMHASTHAHNAQGVGVNKRNKALCGAAGLVRLLARFKSSFTSRQPSHFPALAIDLQRVRYNTHTHGNTRTHEHTAATESQPTASVTKRPHRKCRHASDFVSFPVVTVPLRIAGTTPTTPINPHSGSKISQ